MGAGTWSHATYNTTAGTRLATGTAFGYSSVGKKSGAVNEALDVTKPNSNGEFVRESRDSDEHPVTTPIAIFQDVTGSMASAPETIMKKLPLVYGLLQRKGYVEHPQILFGAIGDAYSDRIPVQVGQFESDNRADEQLDVMVLEGGGGGGGRESYGLTALYMAVASELDSLDKRGQKGLMFIIGDERNHDPVRRSAIREFLGDGFLELDAFTSRFGMEGDIPVADVYEALKEKFEVFCIRPKVNFYYDDPAYQQHWEDLLGKDRVIKVEHVDATVETIVMGVGVTLGTIGIDAVADDLADFEESDSTAIQHARTAVSGLTPVKQASAGSSAVARVEVDSLPDDLD